MTLHDEDINKNNEDYSIEDDSISDENNINHDNSIDDKNHISNDLPYDSSSYLSISSSPISIIISSPPSLSSL